jgi:flagellar export protein FliJ
MLAARPAAQESPMPEPRFVFRAAAALDLRRRLDREAQEALERANAAVSRAEGALADARHALDCACQRPMPIAEEREWYRNWIVGLRAAIRRRSDELDAERRRRETALAAALAARRALRVIERLRDRRLRAFQLEQARREQRSIDELGIQRFQRNSDSGGSP